jgi:hypothetical protein
LETIWREGKWDYQTLYLNKIWVFV